nr:hypothetical protein [Bradyrhizobium japonicum]
MLKRRRVKLEKSFEESLGEEALRLRRQAESLPLGLERDLVLRKARQCETGSHMTDWLRSGGLQPPD